MPDDTQPVGNDAEFIGIAEVRVNVHLPDGGIEGGMGRHGTIGGFIGIKGIIQTVSLFKGFQLFDDTVGIFGIIFSHPCLNAGGIKEQHGRFFLINPLAYRFGQVNKPVEHGL